ncbi:hypothetical protein Tco_0987104, partial [Tanacetum coccineum]
MADVNVNAPAEQAPAMTPPARTDDQILPRIRWVPIGKNNCYLDVERSQSNPIYKIAVDILKHTDSRYSTHLYSNPNTDPDRMPLTKAKG